MTPEEILGYPARVLTQAQREQYFEQGYVGVESLVPQDAFSEVQAVTQQFLEESRKETASGLVFDIGPGHSADNPVLRRLKKPDDQHATYWKFAQAIIADVAADLVGPNVVFHHSKLNFKWFYESDTVKWHQEIQFFPHTNYNVLTIGCYLADTDMQNGPLAVKPGSHNQPLFDQYDKGGNWTGMLSDDDAATIDMSDVPYLTGPAGSITIHNARTLHFSPSSKSAVPRLSLIHI